MRLIDIDEQDIFPGASEIGSDGPADRTCSPDHNISQRSVSACVLLGKECTEDQAILSAEKKNLI
jgi:hypothetical protein